MNIGIMSDSHDHLDNINKALALFKKENCEILLHAGDFVAPFAVKPLFSFDGPIRAVFGNNDGESKLIRQLFFQNRDKAQIETYAIAENINEHHIIVQHGHIPFFLDALIKSQIYHLVVTGHTHQPSIFKEGQTLVVNPGSTAGYMTDHPTVAILNTDDWEAYLIHLDEQ